jgi:DNA polymerase
MPLEILRAQYAGCTQCPLGTQGRTQVVFGVGPANASIMLVGEAPGQDEDIKGIPFIGRSGRLLRQILSECGFPPEEIYITNSAKCRPPENRTPTPYERAACSHLILLKEIHSIRPQVICTIGVTATATFLDTAAPFSSLRGKIIQTEYFAIMPTYHPAYLLRNRSAIDIVKNDFLALKAFLEPKT